jgi:hypothetical protein
MITRVLSVSKDSIQKHEESRILCDKKLLSFLLNIQTRASNLYSGVVQNSQLHICLALPNIILLPLICPKSRNFVQTLKSRGETCLTQHWDPVY